MTHLWRRGRTRRYRTFGGDAVDVELVCQRCGAIKGLGDDDPIGECSPPSDDTP